MMNTTKLIISMLLTGCCLTMSARERTAAEKKALAAEALAGSVRQGAHRAPKEGLKELRRLEGCTLVGYEGGAFAVVSNEDSQTAVLGVSTTPTRGDNPGFEWWLQAMDEVLRTETVSGVVRHAPGPDVKKYPPQVDPLVTCHWGQGDPFYRLCPSHPQDVFCATGCVATAMAQIMYALKQPAHGFGVHTVYYPYMDVKGEAVTADFGQTYYDWDNMIDNYVNTSFTDVQANAVATLMMHCAVAADMQFGGYNHGGSGTTQAAAAEGLKYYFGFENARNLSRLEYADDDWMDIVYGELSQGNPILYGGQNLFGNGGHAFVLHGYNEDGLVLVNWGWNGDAEGWYDIDKLNPTSYRFSERQDMIVGIAGAKTDLQKLEVTLSAAGELSAKLAADVLETCGTLKVTGSINSTDLKMLRQLAGRDDEGRQTMGNLAVLDLSEAEIVGGGEPYLVENNQSYTTKEGELPYKAFYDCRKLTAIKLPKNIRSVGDGALGGCYLLQTVDWPENVERTFLLDGDALYTPDKTQLLAVLPTAASVFEVPATVTKINSLAFAGCVGLNKVNLSASVEEIAGEAFRNCFSLTEIRIHSKVQPRLTGYDTFAGVRTDLCQLLIPSSANKSDYTNRSQWRDFGDNIVMYGTTFTAKTLDKDYGDSNPYLGYEMSGVAVEGQPELTTTATELSLPGEYPIHITAGTVTAPDVEFYDGVLIVYPAQLTVTAVNATRRPDEVSRPYELRFSGFVNGEDETILQELPVVTTSAVDGSPEGTYTLTVTGGKSDRYEFKYRSGTLTVDRQAPSAITTVKADDVSGTVYSLDGRKMEGPLPNGVYVKNGKKIIISNYSSFNY